MYKLHLEAQAIKHVVGCHAKWISLDFKSQGTSSLASEPVLSCPVTTVKKSYSKKPKEMENMSSRVFQNLFGWVHEQNCPAVLHFLGQFDNVIPWYDVNVTVSKSSKFYRSAHHLTLAKPYQGIWQIRWVMPSLTVSTICKWSSCINFYKPMHNIALLCKIDIWD